MKTGILVLLIILGLAGTYIGYSKGYDSGYSQGSYDTGLDKDKEIDRLSSEVADYNVKYSNLATDYNNLRNSVATYLTQAQQAQYKPIRCTSNQILNSVYTNCY